MNYLLDTHIFLWWIADSEKLSGATRAIIADPDNTIHFGVVSAWEISIKSALGRLKLPEAPARFIPFQVQTNGFELLTIQLHHVLRVHVLPPVHRDPFDRLLIAQSLEEKLTLITADAVFRKYKGLRIAWNG